MNIIKYLLSKEGQKSSLLNGGNGRQVQELEVSSDASFFKDFLVYADIKTDGTAIVDATQHTQTGCAVVTSQKHYPHAGWVDGYPEVKETREYKYFDNPQTGEQVLEYLKQMTSDVLFSKATEEQKCESLMVIHQENVKRAEEERQEAIRQESEREAKKAELAKEAARKKAVADVEKKEWVKEYGSTHLNRALDAGYDCKKMYVTERAAHDFPSYILDYDDELRFQDRSCPSLAALDELDRVKARGHEAEIVWCKHQYYGKDGYDELEPGEYIVVHNFMGEYDLIGRTEGMAQ